MTISPEISSPATMVNEVRGTDGVTVGPDLTGDICSWVVPGITGDVSACTGIVVVDTGAEVEGRTTLTTVVRLSFSAGLLILIIYRPSGISTRNP